MWKFQKTLKDSGVQEFTAKEVHADLTAMMLLFLSDIQQEIERKEIPKEVMTEKSLLSKLGFKRDKNTQLASQIINAVAEHNKAYDEKKAALDFMYKAWETFGKDTMVVRYEQFLSLLEKYNLTCGSFDRYTGMIPAENLADIERVVNVLENGAKGMTVPFRYITEIDVDTNNLKWLGYFNLYPMQPALRSHLFRLMGLTLYAGQEKDLDPLDDREEHFDSKLGLFIRNRMDEWNPKRGGITAYDCHTFIVAPEQEMEDFKIKVYSSKVLRKMEEEKRRLIRTADPFVCSLTPYGVMIYTKWGDEAQDGIIKRYEQLRDAIIGNNESTTGSTPEL